MRAAAAQAWRQRWWDILSVAAQGALAATLTGEALATLDGADADPPPEVEVLADARETPPASRLPLRGA